MKKIKLNKKRQLQLHFNYLFNKKSYYLKNLEKVRKEGNKEIENEKVDMLIEKYLGINKFDRDYSFFNQPSIGIQPSSKEESKKKKLNIFPDLKILITSPVEKNDPERYKPKEYIGDNFSNIYKKVKKKTPEKNNRLFGSYRLINRNPYSFEDNNEKYFKRNEKKESSAFLTGIGQHVINNYNDYNDKENLEIPIKRNNIFNFISIK